MKKMLSFERLWNQYPTVTESYEGRKPCKSSLGLSNFMHQCAIRVGTALYGSGVQMYSYPAGGRGWYKGHEGHTLRAWELADWLTKQPDIVGRIKKYEKVSYSNFSYRGILFFKDFWGHNNTRDHIDLWNGFEFPPYTPPDNLEFFERAKEIWLWELI